MNSMYYTMPGETDEGPVHPTLHNNKSSSFIRVLGAQAVPHAETITAQAFAEATAALDKLTAV